MSFRSVVDQRRLKRELIDVQKDKFSGITAELVDEDLTHWKCTFKGPEYTPYDEGIFQLDVVVKEGYPFIPPMIKFDTPVYHPNISSQTGVICLDVLKDQWTPALSIRSALLSIQSLLCTPEPDDPQDAQVASHYKEDRENFNHTARFWTKTYAAQLPTDDMPKPEGAVYVSKNKRKQKKQETGGERRRRLDEGVAEDAAARMAEEEEQDPKVRKLCEMGFTRKAVKRALEMWQGDEEGALEQLLSGES